MGRGRKARKEESEEHPLKRLWERERRVEPVTAPQLHAFILDAERHLQKRLAREVEERIEHLLEMRAPVVPFWQMDPEAWPIKPMPRRARHAAERKVR